MRPVKSTCILVLFILIVALLPFSGCTKDEDPKPLTPEDSVLVFIDDLMNSWYYWYDFVPFVDIYSYTSPEDLLDDLKYEALDKWTYMEKAGIVTSLFEEGETFGFGFLVRFDPKGNLRIIYVHENSTAFSLGLHKGMIVDSINDIPANQFDDFDLFFDNTPASMKFVIRDDISGPFTIGLAKETFYKKGVFYTQLFDNSGTRTGYLVYDSFLQYSRNDLIDALQFFRDNEVDELIVDLRYNQGGHISVAKEFAEIILSEGETGNPLFSYRHNDLLQSERDTTFLIQTHSLNLDLSRIFFLTSRFSASATELLINCLDPYMEVFTIGTPTHGKPVGMYGFGFQDWLIFPVSFLITNANGYGDYFEGLPVDQVAGEGLEYDWGEESEPCLHQALFYIQYGTFDSSGSKKTEYTPFRTLSKYSPLNRKLLIAD